MTYAAASVLADLADIQIDAIFKSDGTTSVECIPLATMLMSYAILTCYIFLAKALQESV